MSELAVKVQTISELRPHPNADRLEIAIVQGWQCIVPKCQYQVGANVVYFPPDTLIPRQWADQFGVTGYLSFGKGNPEMGRIRCAELRGEPSFGLVVEVPDAAWPVGADVAEHYGARKCEPSVRLQAGDGAPDHPLFVCYTNIENLRNYPDVLQPGEQVYVTEKIHGMNTRVGMIDGEPMAGSHRVRRKRPEDDNLAGSPYWFPFTLPTVKALLHDMGATHQQAILFGEVYGKGVQCLDYGQTGRSFAAFDLLVDGHYLDPEQFLDVAREYGIPVVPMLSLWDQPFSIEMVKQLASGKATWGQHLKEGVVVKPIRGRHDPTVGRVIFKYIPDEYMLRQFDEYADQ